MQCPNINTEEWKDLVAKVGEIHAFAMYIENGYEIPTDTVLVPNLTTAEKIQAENLKTFIDIKDKAIQSLNAKIERYATSDKQGPVKQLEKTLKELNDATVERSIIVLLQNAESLVKSLDKKITASETDIKELKRAADYIGTFNSLGGLHGLIDKSTLKNKEAWLKRVGSVAKDIEKLNNNYITYGKYIVAKKMAPFSSYVRDRERELLNMKYRNDNPPQQHKSTSEDWVKKRDEFVEKELAERAESIKRRTEQHVLDQLSKVPQDISAISSWLVDPKGQNDQIIQIVAEMLDNADYNTLTKFIAARTDLLEAHEEFDKGVDKGLATNQQKKYDLLIEKQNGKATGYYTAAIYNDALSAYKEYQREVFTQLDRINDTTVGEAENNKAKEELARINKEFKEKYIKAEHRDKLIKGNDVHDLENHGLYKYIKDKYKNPEWQKLKADPRRHKMWTTLTSFNRESDKLVGRGKLGYRLPSMRKGTAERIAEGGYVGSMWEVAKDAVTLNANDVEEGMLETHDGVTKVKVDENGKVIERINLPYRQDIEMSERSFDLLGMALANRHASLNYSEKNSIKADLEVVRDLMGERSVGQYKGLNKLVSSWKNINGVTEEETRDIEEKGLGSNSYKAYASMIEDRLYGKQNVDGGEIFGMNKNKASNTLMKLSGHNFLMLNYMGATSNVIQGKVMNFLMGVKGNDFDRKNLRKGEALYMSDIKGMVKDIDQLAPKSKTNLLMEQLLGTSMGFDMFVNDLVKDSRIKRAFSVKSLHGLNATAEHYIQGTLMYSILDKIEIDGKKAHELIKVENNRLVVPENVDMRLIAKKVKAVVARAHGNYDANNKAMAQRYWYGKLGFFLRKWIVRGTMQRWRGVETTKKGMSVEQMLKETPNLLHHSQEMERFEEGTYTSAVRFLRNSWKQMITLKTDILKQDWNKISDMERENIRSAVTEFGLMVGAFIASTLLMGLAEEEDEEWLYSLAYYHRRLYGELMFYTPLNPSEAMRVLRTPSATISTLELATKTMGQLLEDTGSLATGGDIERYETGKRKGKSKSFHYVNQLTNPIYKQFDKDTQQSLKFLINSAN